jgi:hypothetical protein
MSEFDAATLEELPPIVIDSAAELKAALTQGFDGWSAFRNSAAQ